MTTPQSIANALARTWTSGPWHVNGLIHRGSRLLGHRCRWLNELAQRLIDDLGGSQRPRFRQVAAWLLADDRFQAVCERYSLVPPGMFGDSPVMSPAAGPPSTWHVPAVNTLGELADWLGVTGGELDWFAGVGNFQRNSAPGPVRNYHYRWVRKRSAGARLLEAPKPRLKEIQRRILHEILDHVPAHGAVHGFRRGRSIATFAAPHAQKSLVLRLDLEDFFATIRGARVAALLRALGYPETVARHLCGLCTNQVPSDVLEACPTNPDPIRMRSIEQLYRFSHLPQGAPTSPALANLCFYRCDARLAALAEKSSAVYTRYADDLVFSGGPAFARRARRFYIFAASLILEEGFEVHWRKTRIMRSSVRQHVAGLVVNSHVNIKRRDYDRLKAILWNCVRLGPAGQNKGNHADFRAHLTGKVAFVAMVNPKRGQRLRELLDRVDWRG